MIKNIGKKVKTENGDGVIIAIEFNDTPKIARYLIKMDNKVDYDDNIMAFSAKEVEFI